MSSQDWKNVQFVKVADVETLLDAPGIYAWYYLPKIDPVVVSNVKSGISDESKIPELIKEIQHAYQRSSGWHFGNDYSGLNNPMRGKRNQDNQLRLVGTLSHDNMIHESPSTNAISFRFLSIIEALCLKSHQRATHCP